MIELDDVFCLYRGAERDVAALRGLTLAVAAGERVLVTGPSGAGKTTLVRIATGHERPSAGRARVLGEDVGALDARGLARLRRHGIAVVDQRSGRALLPELSAIDNVALRLGLLGEGRRARRARAAALLARVGLEGLGERRPAALSGGQAQRVAVCAAVAHAPGAIVADEPTGELDAETADVVLALLGELAQATGAGLLVVSHDLRAAAHADRLLRIRDGRLSEERAPADGPERQVVDARGWLRLPAELRDGAGLGARARAEADARGIVLIGDAARSRAPEATAAPPAVRGEHVVRLRGVGRTYAPGEPPALAPLDLDLHRGELLAVRGRSGSGKSTLLRLVAGLDRPDVGTVEVLGSALADLDRDGLARLRRAHVGVSTQASALVDDLPLADGIGAGLALRGRPTAVVEELLGAVGLGELSGRPAGRLSGGERQRGAVVRALAGGTALVVLDEPTSQLDEASAALVAQVLLAAARAGRAVLVATHDPALLACADRVLELEQPGPRAG